MTTRDGFTRLVDTWLAEEGVQTTPDYLDEVLDRTSTSRQRPAWLSPGRWLPVDTTTLNPRAYSIPPVVRYGVLAALLIGARGRRGRAVRGIPAPPRAGAVRAGRQRPDLLRCRRQDRHRERGRDGPHRRSMSASPHRAPYVSPDGTKFAFVLIDPLRGRRRRRARRRRGRGEPASHLAVTCSLDIDPAFNPTWSPDSTSSRSAHSTRA